MILEVVLFGVMLWLAVDTLTNDVLAVDAPASEVTSICKIEPVARGVSRNVGVPSAAIETAFTFDPAAPVCSTSAPVVSEEMDAPLEASPAIIVVAIG